MAMMPPWTTLDQTVKQNAASMLQRIPRSKD
jgi:hypothetical protein